MYHCCWSIATCLMLEMISALFIVHFNSCLTTKIEVSKQRHRWVIDNIWFPNAHLCPVGPRVLDTCSLIYRAIHIWGVWAPLSQSLIPSYFLGPQTSLRFYLLSCTYAMLLLYLNCATDNTLYCLGSGHVFAVSTSPVWGSQSLTAVHPNLGSVSELAYFVAGSLMGWPPEMFLNLVIALS